MSGQVASQREQWPVCCMANRHRRASVPWAKLQALADPAPWQSQQQLLWRAQGSSRPGRLTSCHLLAALLQLRSALLRAFLVIAQVSDGPYGPSLHSTSNDHCIFSTGKAWWSLLKEAWQMRTFQAPGVAFTALAAELYQADILGDRGPEGACSMCWAIPSENLVNRQLNVLQHFPDIVASDQMKCVPRPTLPDLHICWVPFYTSQCTHAGWELYLDSSTYLCPLVWPYCLSTALCASNCRFPHLQFEIFNQRLEVDNGSYGVQVNHQPLT